MRKAVPLVLATVLAVLAVLGFTSGSTLLVVLGALALVLAIALAALHFLVLRDPEAAMDRLAARRAELEARSGRTRAQDDVAQDDSTTATPAPLNREQRRAQDRQQ